MESLISFWFYGGVILCIVFALFMLARELMLWYWKINSLIKNQDKVIENQTKMLSVLSEMLKIEQEKNKE